MAEPNTMEKLKETFDTWMEDQCRNGHRPNYDLMFSQDCQMSILSGKHCAEVTSFTAITLDGAGNPQFVTGDSSSNEAEEKPNVSFIMRKRKQLILEVGENLFGYGFSDAEMDSGDLVLIFLADGIQTIISASGDKLDVSDHFLEIKPDVLQAALRNIFQRSEGGDGMERGVESHV